MLTDSKYNLENKIRRGILPDTGEQVFSVVDVIGEVTKSVDPRNYWKVLKNRLKKEPNELVTGSNQLINQLKLAARDGKLYLTDVANVETLTEIIKLVPGAEVNDLHSCLAPFIDTPIQIPPTPEIVEEQKLPEVYREPGEAELLIDMYEKGGTLYIEAFVAGVPPENLTIETTRRKITIYGKRISPLQQGQSLLNGRYVIQELAWLTFERTIIFPFPVHTEKIESIEHDGRLVIRIPKLI